METTTIQKLTSAQKRQIAKLAVEKSNTVENGRMHVWYDGSQFSILINSEYRDDKHKHICTLEVWNENKQRTQAQFIRQIENK